MTELSKLIEGLNKLFPNQVSVWENRNSKTIKIDVDIDYFTHTYIECNEDKFYPYVERIEFSKQTLKGHKRNIFAHELIERNVVYILEVFKGIKEQDEHLKKSGIIRN